MARRRNKHLIILRGLPASGKTTRANEILKKYNSGEIYSTDDYFKDENGDWIHPTPTVGKRHAAHKQLIAKVFEAIRKRVHPIVIDNTNLERWEMWPYVNRGYRRRYKVLFVDLQKEEQSKENPISLETVYERCKGSISWRTLQNMEERYEYNVNVHNIVRDPKVRNKWFEMNKILSRCW